MITAAPTSAEQIFGACGRLVTNGHEFRVGYWSYYGFHTRAVSVSRADALTRASESRLPDDPSPADQSWVPSSYSDHFSPYRKGITS